MRCLAVGLLLVLAFMGCNSSPAAQPSTPALQPQPAATAPTPAPAPEPTPTSELAKLRLYMLDLINEARGAAGIPPVVLGSSAVAQLHAEDQRDNCYEGQWDSDGLKSYMRYSFAGGYHANGWNTYGLDACLQPGYAEIDDLYQEAREAVRALAGDEQHDPALFDPAYRVVNIGLAYDPYTLWVVQQFETAYVSHLVMPVLDGDILTVAGMTIDDMVFRSPRELDVQLYYDPLPRPLTAGQLVRTYRESSGRLIASFRPPPLPGEPYEDASYTYSYQPSPDPHDVPPDASVPRESAEASMAWKEAIEASQNTPAQTVKVAWVTAEAWRAEGNRFEVKANISELLDQFGPGVYTIIAFGPKSGGSSLTQIIGHSTLVE